MDIAQDDPGPGRRGAPGRPLRDLALFVGAFAGLWGAAVAAAWWQGWLDEAARPWFRTALWCLAAAAWIRWQRTDRPFAWLGLGPVTARAAAKAAIAFAAVLGWNMLRVAVLGASAGGLAGWPPAAYAWSLVGVAVEELVFRGVIQTRLGEHTPAAVAITASSLLFLGIHVPGWIMLGIRVDAMIVVSVFLIGALCGRLRHRSRSLWPAVAAHWAKNLGAQL